MLTAMWKLYRVVVVLARREAFGSSESTLRRLLLWLRRRVHPLVESEELVEFARNGVFNPSLRSGTDIVVRSASRNMLMKRA
jgi:hypothetical protein